MAEIVSQTFLILDDFDKSEKCWTGILYNVPRLGFVLCSSYD